MISCYLRSSSLGTYDLCPFQHLLCYVLGLENRPNWRTEIGSMVHKVLELLARKKVCFQDDSISFDDDELKKSFIAKDLTVEDACLVSFEHYSIKNQSRYNWSEVELQSVRDLVKYTIEFNDGMFNPENRDILMPEQYFDLPIEEPWAYYNYKDPHTDKNIEGQLRIKGSVDLVTRVGDVIEYIDWKTGARKNWAKNKEKDYKALRQDTQLMLYFYALSRLYPDSKALFVTIFFCRDGGPFSIFFDKERDNPYILAMLKNKFETIKNDYNPRRVWDTKDKWRICKGFCNFGKDMRSDGKTSDCEFYKKELEQLGMDKLIKKYGKPNAYLNYADGGGQSNREGSKE